MYLLFIVISLETPVLPVKQWEEHLKLREMVEEIRKRQAGMVNFNINLYLYMEWKENNKVNFCISQLLLVLLITKLFKLICVNHVSAFFLLSIRHVLNKQGTGYERQKLIGVKSESCHMKEHRKLYSDCEIWAWLEKRELSGGSLKITQTRGYM